VLLIRCPHCGPRSEDEFVYGGDANQRRPAAPASVPDSEWLAYIYERHNPKGPHVEWWFHMHGCRLWMRVTRDTMTHRIASVEAATLATRP
jgi:heterotetrameric sarcosine oxidase delta subunit